MNKPNLETNDELDFEVQRSVARQPILLRALLDTGKFEFECLAYDLSIKGMKLKLDLPLESGCTVSVKVKGKPGIPARVIWVKAGFIGLEFSVPTEVVLNTLGALGANLPTE